MAPSDPSIATMSIRGSGGSSRGHHRDDDNYDLGVPLRRWIAEEEAECTSAGAGLLGADDIANSRKRSFLRRATVAYGLAELLGRARRGRGSTSSSSSEGAARMIHGDGRADGRDEPSFGIDNFVVYVASGRAAADVRREARARATTTTTTMAMMRSRSWDEITGVSMISPSLSARMTEPSFLSAINAGDENESGGMGRYLEVEVTSTDAGTSLPPGSENSPIHAAGALGNGNNNEDCRLFGMLLYELYSGVSPVSATNNGNGSSNPNSLKREEGPARKKLSLVRYDKRKGKSYSTASSRRGRPYDRSTPLRELGCPSSVCALARRLLDGDEGDGACNMSLDEVKADVHLLVCDPECFLFDREDVSSSPAVAMVTSTAQHQQGGGNGRGTAQLRVKRGKLYGREDEVSLITDAYCRVSSGENAAVFVGGYSGSGKTMLVQSVMARVDVNGGYVLSQKVDQMTKERPLLGVLSAFDRLCLLIRDKCPQNELLGISKRLAQDFESDCSVARLLPNVSALFPRLPSKTARSEAGIEQMMNLQNVCFTLRRFMRIVSSRRRPVMLFLDDLQLAAASTLELVEALLSDGGPSCFFFVGSYRDNEVRRGHPVLELMSRLLVTTTGGESSPVYTSSLNLSGLGRGDLNIMIAETLGMFPRLCKPLSDIVFEKTKGSPLFALEFLRSLVDSRLLKYSLRERRWIWDEGKIADENITDNVLHLLTAKMKSLPENTQLVLRVLSCFGTEVKESVVGYLSSTPQYSDFPSWLNHAIEEGCVLQKAGSVKFVHDKVREAAYELIPGNKNEFHHSLGMLIISSAGGQDLSGSVLFQVVDQINHGIPSLIQPTSCIYIMHLNFRAGSRAMDLSDFETAKSYLKNALALLPNDSWVSNYEFSLRLFFLTANAAYSCGNKDEAYDSLKKIIDYGRCIKDKLDAYHLYATILHACEESGEAYTICQTVLSQLDESIPDSVDKKKLMAMVKETGLLLRKKISCVNDLLEMKEIDGVIRFKLKFYNLLNMISFWRKPEMLAFYSCRIIHLTLEHGVCEDSVSGFVQYAAMVCGICQLVPQIQEADRISMAAMSLFKQRFDSSKILPRVYICYYGYVADRTQPIQMCSNYLRKGFEVGMSAGDSVGANLCIWRLVFTSLIGGENLCTLLKEIDDHLETRARLHLKLLTPGIVAHRETISILIGTPTGKVHSTSTQNNNSNPSDENMDPMTAEYAQSHKRAIYLNRMLQSFWLGYSQRCHHYAKKALEMPTFTGHYRLIVLFYAALNAFRGIKNNNGNGSRFVKVKALYKDALSELQNAAELSPWNFRGKVFLLEAELCSFEQRSEDAKSSYAAAITSSCSSRFVHEEGLACELAALHRLKVKEVHAAINFFQQAKECYSRWGSHMKVEFITQQLENISSMHVA